MDTTTEIEKPLVSILMLTYNRATYIGEAVRSVINQSYQNWELFIIDDGSTDDTQSIVSRFSDPRIHYIRHEENAGLLARRQESLTRATGTYVAVLDSDDVWDDVQKLEKQVSYLEGNPTTVIVGSYIRLIDENSNLIGANRYHTNDKKIRGSLLYRNQFAHSSVLMRQSALQKTSGYRFPLAEDLDLFLQLGLHGTFANLPEQLTSYRVHTASETNRKRAMLKNITAIIEAHKDSYPGYLCGMIKYSLYKFLTKS